MNTLRSRLPVLISECISKGFTITFSNDFTGPTVAIRNNSRTQEYSDHIHLNNFVNDNHGANSILMVEALSAMLYNYENKEK